MAAELSMVKISEVKEAEDSLRTEVVAEAQNSKKTEAGAAAQIPLEILEIPAELPVVRELQNLIETKEQVKLSSEDCSTIVNARFYADKTVPLGTNCLELVLLDQPFIAMQGSNRFVDFKKCQECFESIREVLLRSPNINTFIFKQEKEPSNTYFSHRDIAYFLNAEKQFYELLANALKGTSVNTILLRNLFIYYQMIESDQRYFKCGPLDLVHFSNTMADAGISNLDLGQTTLFNSLPSAMRVEELLTCTPEIYCASLTCKGFLLSVLCLPFTATYSACSGKNPSACSLHPSEFMNEPEAIEYRQKDMAHLIILMRAFARFSSLITERDHESRYSRRFELVEGIRWGYFGSTNYATQNHTFRENTVNLQPLFDQWKQGLAHFRCLRLGAFGLDNEHPTTKLKNLQFLLTGLPMLEELDLGGQIESGSHGYFTEVDPEDYEHLRQGRSRYARDIKDEKDAFEALLNCMSSSRIQKLKGLDLRWGKVSVFKRVLESIIRNLRTLVELELDCHVLTQHPDGVRLDSLEYGPQLADWINQSNITTLRLFSTLGDLAMFEGFVERLEKNPNIRVFFEALRGDYRGDEPSKQDYIKQFDALRDRLHALNFMNGGGSHLVVNNLSDCGISRPVGGMVLQYLNYVRNNSSSDFNNKSHSDGTGNKSKP